MKSVIERFIPAPQICERHSTIVRAPASLVFEIASKFDITSIPLVRGIFRLRAKILGAAASIRPLPLIEGMQGIGWGCLAREPDRFYIAGAVCRPWLPDVVFSPVAPEQFTAFAEPGQVKIAWMIEVEPLGPDRTRFSTETRAAGTDEGSRKKFRSYWRRFGIGIILIRKLLLFALRRAAEQKYRDTI